MPRMLIVDDEAEVLDELSEVFSEYGYEIETAQNGADGIEKVKSYRPHVMLLDVRMPGLDGIEALKLAKDVDPGIGVIMVTAVADQDEAKRAMEIGAFDYITKPIDLNYLRTSVVVKMINMLGSEKVDIRS